MTGVRNHCPRASAVDTCVALPKFELCGWIRHSDLATSAPARPTDARHTAGCWALVLLDVVDDSPGRGGQAGYDRVRNHRRYA